jgi:hypothetical protein
MARYLKFSILIAEFYFVQNKCDKTSFESFHLEIIPWSLTSSCPPFLLSFFYSIQLHNRRIDTVGISFLDGRTDDGSYLADANVGVMFRFSLLLLF